MNMNLSDEQIVGDGHTIKALTERVAQLEAAQNALQKSFEQECGDVDTLLVLLQLNPHDYRSDAGWLLLRKIYAVIAARDAERDALREQSAKSCSEGQVKLLAEAFEKAMGRLEDMMMGDDGQAWSETERAMPALRAVRDLLPTLGKLRELERGA